MLPWDYNLAFGGFQGNDAESAVNDPIDDVLSDRPMQAWMFSSEEYTALYHEYYEEFLQSADIDGLIDEAYSLIAPYVEKDPTKFCTYDEFETGVQTLKNFCYLRAQSVTGQLDGSIPSTRTRRPLRSPTWAAWETRWAARAASAAGRTMTRINRTPRIRRASLRPSGRIPARMPEQILRRIRREVRPRARRTVKMVRLPDKQMGRGAAVQAARRRFCSRPARWSSHWDSGVRFSTSEDKKQDGSGRDRPVFTEFQSLRRGRCPHRPVRKPVF